MNLGRNQAATYIVTGFVWEGKIYLPAGTPVHGITHQLGEPGAKYGEVMFIL